MTETEVQQFKEEMKIVENDNGEGSKEERQYRLWVNSLNIDGLRLTNLFQDIKKGVVLLKILDRVQQGSIDWSKVEQNPNNTFKKQANANYAIKIAKEVFKLSLVGIGGQDIANGHRQMTLALVWQLVYKHTMQTIGNINDKQLLAWVNTKLPSNEQIKNLSDKSLSNSLRLF